MKVNVLRKMALKKDIVLGDKMLLKKRARVKWQSNKSPENR
jgi:predicted transposase YbfD/YdcC